jgi:hypothetical protein
MRKGQLNELPKRLRKNCDDFLADARIYFYEKRENIDVYDENKHKTYKLTALDFAFCGQERPDPPFRSPGWQEIQKTHPCRLNIGGRQMMNYPHDVVLDWIKFVCLNKGSEMFTFDYTNGRPLYVASDHEMYEVTLADGIK